MSNIKSARGIILKKTKYGESDLIIQLILSSGEKLSTIARGALRSKKRFSGGVLDPTNYVQIQYRDQGDHKLSTLEEAQILDGFDGLRTDYDRMELGLQIISAISKISQHGDSLSEGLFNLLGHALRGLQGAKNLVLFRGVFGLKLLYQQGVLEQDPWMNSAFKSNFKDWVNFEEQIQIPKDRLQWIDNQLKQYLQSASTHGQNF
jgi:DNA repair protein RecO (recombination protein O)